jgi:hypothetical protein
VELVERLDMTPTGTQTDSKERKIMKTTSTTTILVLLLLLTSCNKKADRSVSTEGATVPIAQLAMTAWEQGDKPTAINRFVQANWSTVPLFAANSTLSLSEEQFQALSNTDRNARSREMMSQLDAFKKLTAAVAQAGRDAASKGETAQAREYFTSLKRCGMALDQPGCLRLRILQLVGQALGKMADAGLAKLPQ